jgi:hypothetical protein
MGKYPVKKDYSATCSLFSRAAVILFMNITIGWRVEWPFLKPN